MGRNLAPEGVGMSTTAEACVLGDYDLVAPLARARVRCAVVAPHTDPVAQSRLARHLGWADPCEQPDQLMDLLRRHAASQPAPPGLYYQSDAATLFISRHRAELATSYRFVIAEADLVEDLIDKTRFRDLAHRLGLPVPPSGVLDSSTGPALEPHLEFPVVVKPAARLTSEWSDLMHEQKALHVPDQAALEALWPLLKSWGGRLITQQLVPGPESLIESYHCYVDAHGELVADFTGRKVRTSPATYGQSTSVTITADAEVSEVGRRVISAVGLTGVAKCDFKRGPDGRLWLLEINPRFNLWHHPGALAGVNLPALVHASLTGLPPTVRPTATPGVSWLCAADLQAAREAGVPLWRWAAFAWRCGARRNLAWDDPGPVLHRVTRTLRRSSAPARTGDLA